MAGYLGSVPVPQATQHRETFTATAGQTTFNTAGYTPLFVDVYLNGVHLSPADITATNGSDVVLAECVVNDIVDIVSYTPFEVANQTFTGTTTMTDVVAATLDISGNIDIDGTTNLDVVDIDGAVDMATTALVTGVLTTTAATVFNGGFASNDGSTISTADNTTQLTLISTDADANVGPVLDLYRNSSSPADNDVIGRIVFNAENDADEKTELIRIIALMPDVSNGSEDVTLQYYLMKDGSRISRMEHSSTETVFNQDSADVDFRVESNGNANMLFVDAGNDAVGINTSSPSAPLQVAYAPSDTVGDVGISLKDKDNAIEFGLRLDATSKDLHLDRYFNGGWHNHMSFDRSTGNVGINTSSPAANLHLKSTTSGDPELRIEGSGTDNGIITFLGGGHSNPAVAMRYISSGDSVGHLAFYANGSSSSTLSEHMRIDSSGNLLVAGTNNSPATNNVAGSSHGSLGNIQASVDGNPCLFLNRKSSDGDIVSFRQDGAAVGSIGTPYNNELSITASGTNSSGILLSSSNQVRPMKNGSTSDSTQDLGASNGKWKDLYLSGGVYLGGTGAANKLDDYEEGTFTATLTSATPPSTPPTVTGLYTKIGRSVTVSMFFESVNTSGGSGSMVVTGLPFAAGSATGNRGSGAVQFYSMTFSGEYAVAEASSSQINFRGIASNAAWQDISITAGTGRYLQTTLTYTTA